MKIRASRLGIATTSAISYPAIVSAIAVGITTFTVVPVFAESGYYLDCTHPGVASCDGKDEMTSCDCGNNPYVCACQKYTCNDPDGGGSDGGTSGGPGSKLREGLACQVISNCETNPSITACNGKNPNTTCTTSTNRPGTCRQWPCSTLGPNNKYGSPSEKLTCVPNDDLTGGPSTTPSPSPTTSSSSSSSGSSPSTTPASNDDSGCSTTPSSSTTTGAFGAAAITLAVGTLLRMRRRMKKRGE